MSIINIPGKDSLKTFTVLKCQLCIFQGRTSLGSTRTPTSSWSTIQGSLEKAKLVEIVKIHVREVLSNVYVKNGTNKHICSMVRWLLSICRSKKLSREEGTICWYPCQGFLATKSFNHHSQWRAQWNILKAADTSCLEQTGHILSTLPFRLRRLIYKSLLILVNCCEHACQREGA